ncbi:hypothetical protein GJ744_004013 [Endocarpon pusillum]|uniref:Uncharacterized protein n=1 Tax=Endocarpon pusillum TaxID=364733 RepID=A0A8H7E1R9_9EURO|nr:hypothetical protein GJ744_004013 [Endocarpon pusillum]
MVTSRNEGSQQYATAKAIALDDLPDQAARDLLLKAASVPIPSGAMLRMQVYVSDVDWTSLKRSFASYLSAYSDVQAAHRLNEAIRPPGRFI